MSELSNLYYPSGKPFRLYKDGKRYMYHPDKVVVSTMMPNGKWSFEKEALSLADNRLLIKKSFSPGSVDEGCTKHYAADDSIEKQEYFTIRRAENRQYIYSDVSKTQLVGIVQYDPKTQDQINRIEFHPSGKIGHSCNYQDGLFRTVKNYRDDETNSLKNAQYYKNGIAETAVFYDRENNKTQEQIWHDPSIYHMTQKDYMKDCTMVTEFKHHFPVHSQEMRGDRLLRSIDYNALGQDILHKIYYYSSNDVLHGEIVERPTAWDENNRSTFLEARFYDVTRGFYRSGGYAVRNGKPVEEGYHVQRKTSSSTLITTLEEALSDGLYGVHSGLITYFENGKEIKEKRADCHTALDGSGELCAFSNLSNKPKTLIPG